MGSCRHPDRRSPLKRLTIDSRHDIEGHVHTDATTAAWILGDIHGCYRELQVLEKRIRRQAKKRGHVPLFVSVGDLVDRGPGSRQVVEHFLRGEAAGTHRAVAGNHEAMMLRCLWEARPDLFEAAGADRPEWVESVQDGLSRIPSRSRMASLEEWQGFGRLMWVMQGGAETLESYGCDPSRAETWNLPVEHVRYLASLPLFWQNDECVVTHALAQAEDLEILRSGSLGDRTVQMRVLWSRALPREAPDPNRPHVSGHTVMNRIQRARDLNIVRIDLGAYQGHRLGAWCPRHDRMVSVPSQTQWPTTF